MEKVFTVKYAAELMGVTEQFLRMALKRNKYPLWGTAVLSDNGKRYKYIIHAVPFMRYINGDWDPREVQ